MQFRVPQFIDVEDKIFGPFSFRQFVYLVGGAGISFILYKILPLLIAIIFILPVLGLSLALTFAKVNNKPFINALESYLSYASQSKLYVWKKRTRETKSKDSGIPIPPAVNTYIPKLSESKLKDMSWSLDVLDVNKKDK